MLCGYLLNNVHAIIIINPNEKSMDRIFAEIGAVNQLST